MLWFGLKKRVQELEDKSVTADKLVVGKEDRVGMWGLPYKADILVDQSEAILAIASHIGLKFQVEPASPQSIALVKEKKK